MIRQALFIAAVVLLGAGTVLSRPPATRSAPGMSWAVRQRC